jgi:nucleotide-binding universal stress UspA family protein
MQSIRRRFREVAVRQFEREEFAVKILLAVDGSAYSDAAVEEIAKRPWPSGSEIKVITAAERPIIVGMEPWAASPEYYEQIETAVREAAKTVIEKSLLKLKGIADKSLKVSSEIIPGPARQVIIDEAEHWNADLIVLGSRGLGAWNRLLLGSVSSAVVHHAKCSVEIVRTH